MVAGKGQCACIGVWDISHFCCDISDPFCDLWLNPAAVVQRPVHSSAGHAGFPGDIIECDHIYVLHI